MSGPLLAGAMLGAALALGLLIGTMAPAAVEQPIWPPPGGPWPT